MGKVVFMGFTCQSPHLENCVLFEEHPAFGYVHRIRFFAGKDLLPASALSAFTRIVVGRRRTQAFSVDRLLSSDVLFFPFFFFFF